MARKKRPVATRRMAAMLTDWFGLWLARALMIGKAAAGVYFIHVTVLPDGSWFHAALGVALIIGAALNMP